MTKEKRPPSCILVCCSACFVVLIVSAYPVWCLINVIGVGSLDRRLDINKDPEFQVVSASVSGLKVTGTDLTATWNMTLLVTNLNRKLVMNFDRVQASIYYGSKDDGLEDCIHEEYADKFILAKKDLSPFFLYIHNQTHINFRIGVVEASVRDKLAAKQISDGKALGGPVKFGLRLVTIYRYRIKGWDAGSPNNYVVFCEPLEFLLSPNTSDTGILTATSRSCS